MASQNKIINSKELFEAIESLGKERGISKQTVCEALQNAIVKAYQKDIDPEGQLEVLLDEKNHTLAVYKIWRVVDEIDDDLLEIMSNDERIKDLNLQPGDNWKEIIDISEVFSLLGTVQTKQILKQLVNEATKITIYETFIDKKNTIINGVIETIEDDGKITVDIGGTIGFLPHRCQIRNEFWENGQMGKFYIVDVLQQSRGWQIILSRSSPHFVEKLFEKEVPEISEGLIEIKGIARIAGLRSKVAVVSHNSNVDAIGACIGPKGVRIRSIISEFNNEKIDVVEWSENPEEFLINAMLPIKCISVIVTDHYKREAIIIVPNDKLSIAVGKNGNNIRMINNLTGWRIDIKSINEAIDEGIDYVYNGNYNPEEIESDFDGYNKDSFVEDKPVIKPKNENVHVFEGVSAPSKSNPKHTISNSGNDEALKKTITNSSDRKTTVVTKNVPLKKEFKKPAPRPKAQKFQIPAEITEKSPLDNVFDPKPLKKSEKINDAPKRSWEIRKEEMKKKNKLKREKQKQLEQQLAAFVTAEEGNKISQVNNVESEEEEGDYEEYYEK